MTNIKNIVFFDTETTGLDPVSCRVIELAAIRYEFDGTSFVRMEDMDDFITLPEGETVPDKIVEITGITTQILKEKGQSEEIVAKKFTAMIDHPDTVLVAHNIQFDLSFITYTVFRGDRDNIGLISQADYLDTLTIAKDRKMFPHKLCDMIDYYGLDAQNSHRALDDVDALAKLYFAMQQERDDVLEYINKFGVNPRYGLNGKPFKSVSYFLQPYRNDKDLIDPADILPRKGVAYVGK